MLKLKQKIIYNESGQYFYARIKFKGLRKRCAAWIRIMIWGFCPACNSDAPELYDCPCCNYATGSPFKRSQRKHLWNKWKYLNHINNL